MGTDDLRTLATIVAQTLVPLGVALLLLHIYRRHPKDYVIHWARSWIALSAFYFFTGLTLPIDNPLLAWDFVRWVALPLATAAAFLHYCWLALGSVELVRSRPVRIDTVTRLTIVLPILGIGVSITATLLAPSLLVLADWHYSVYFLLSGGIFLSYAFIVWTNRRRGEINAIELLAVSFAAYGFFQLVHMLLHLSWSRGFATTPGTESTEAVVLALQVVVGFSMIACLLDEEREAATLAASQIEHMAYHDNLTGLPNRSLFFDRLIMALNRAPRADRKVAVLFVDVDDFKRINDSLGHSAGDAVLRATADRFSGIVRKEDTVARFGGDEFVIVLSDIRTAEGAIRVAVKLLDAMRKPIDLDHRQVVLTSSIGISLYPDDAASAESLVRSADAAMYRAKEIGKNNYRLYAASMGSLSIQNLELESDLRTAIEKQELVLHYQPYFDFVNRKVKGFEALLRWMHPTLGLTPPERFIPVAEASGLIIPIGDWVIRQACRQLRIWRLDRNLDVVMSVNLSARQFIHTELVDQIRDALTENGIPGNSLEVEITESSAIRDIPTTDRILYDLKRLGVRIAIDDFGTGYSSLNYLKRFPIDTLKLDQSFVQDISRPQDAAIAKGIIEMAHGMNLHVVAEGVETEWQYSFLKEHACDWLQGFLLSEPLSSTQFDTFMSENDSLFTRLI